MVCILGGELVDWYEDAISRGARNVEKEMEIEESACCCRWGHRIMGESAIGEFVA